MITVEKSGKTYIPPEDGFIGYAGDNQNKTIQFLLKERNDSNCYYRIYLRFDDGTVNFFLTESQVQANDTIVYWNIKDNHIFKSGIVFLQIKGFNSTGEIFHTEPIPLLSGKSIEFGNSFAKNQITEFLEKEKELRQLYSDIENAKDFLPYIGGNGNWFVYDYDSKTFVDSNITAKGSADEYPIEYSISQSSDNSHVPSSKAVYNYVELLRTKVGELSYLNTEDKTSVVNSINELNTAKKNIALKTDMLGIGMSVAYDENMNVLQTSTNTVLSAGNLYAENTAYVYISSSVVTIQSGVMNFDKLKLIVMDNKRGNINTSIANIPESVKVIYTQNLDTVPTALMKMAYANSEIFKNYYNKTDSKSRFAQGISAIYDAKGNIVRACSKTSLSGGDLFGDSSVKTAFISNNVTSIGSGTFSGCTNLETVYIDNTQSNLEHGGLTIESGAIPFGAEIIYTDEFNGVAHNTEAIASINESVNNLNACAILNETVAFDENGVVLKTSNDTVIGGGIFTRDTAIKKVFIPSSVTEIQSGGFYGCSNLTEMTIDNVEGQVTISPGAIPENVDIVYTNKFNGVTANAKAIAFMNNSINNLEGSAILNETVAFDENGVVVKTFDETVISGGIFTGNTAIKKVFIPSSVTEIQSGGFYGCSNLTEITIDNVEDEVIISSNAIPENAEIVYTNKFNVVTTLCKAVEHLNNAVSTLSLNARTVNKSPVINEKEV